MAKHCGKCSWINWWAEHILPRRAASAGLPPSRHNSGSHFVKRRDWRAKYFRCGSAQTEGLPRTWEKHVNVLCALPLVTGKHSSGRLDYLTAKVPLQKRMASTVARSSSLRLVSSIMSGTRPAQLWFSSKENRRIPNLMNVWVSGLILLVDSDPNSLMKSDRLGSSSS